MTQQTPIEAVRNRKNQKLFILIDDTIEARYKVINPAGETLILPDLLFDEDPLTVPADQAAKEFSPEQMTAFAVHLERQATLAAQAALRPKEPPRPPTVTVAPPSRPRTPSAKKAPMAMPRRGLAASWSAPKLTFYRHKIEPLAPKQSFKVTVEGTGDFEITKEDFLAQFNDVVMSPSYIREGLFSYPKVPDKARRFLKV